LNDVAVATQIIPSFNAIAEIPFVSNPFVLAKLVKEDPLSAVKHKPLSVPNHIVSLLTTISFVEFDAGSDPEDMECTPRL
jgi:hypothetical protein